METLSEAVAFVNEQAAFHDRKRRAYEDKDPRRFAQHLKVYTQFTSLAAFLEGQAEYVDRLEDEISKSRPLNGLIQLSLRLEDIEGLPDELMRELSITEGDLADFAIQSLMREHAGVMSLDQLLIGLFRKTGEIHKRSNLNARIYRMTKKNALFDVPGRKGVYSIRPMSEDESQALERPATDQAT